MSWIISKHEYEGFPLFLRYPDSLNYDDLQSKFPTLIVVTLEFAEITDNGLPVATYNYSLEPFDIFVVDYFSDRSSGQCVLVETFHGRRHYYTYASEVTDISSFEGELGEKFPQHSYAVEIDKPDPQWSFIRRYAKDYFHKPT